MENMQFGEDSPPQLSSKMDSTNNNSTSNDSKKTEKRADFFDMVTLK
jgi:hypothetical protein